MVFLPLKWWCSLQVRGICLGNAPRENRSVCLQQYYKETLNALQLISMPSWLCWRLCLAYRPFFLEPAKHDQHWKENSRPLWYLNEKLPESEQGAEGTEKSVGLEQRSLRHQKWITTERKKNNTSEYFQHIISSKHPQLHTYLFKSHKSKFEPSRVNSLNATGQKIDGLFFYW